VYVKVLEIDRNGKIRLSRREAMKEMGLKSSAEHAAD
jgi:predicted RNA-binding protein with RPS1 domain